jgi:hypothetical protein
MMLKNYKLILITAVITTAIIVLAFVTGTFYPNKWTKQKIEKIFHKAEVKEATYLGFAQPEFDYNDKKTFIEATGKCVDFLNFTTDRMNRVPTSIIIAMAGIESAWGKSRFAVEGNALFGVRTWDMTVPHMKPQDLPDADFGVKKYGHEREKQLDAGKWNYQQLLKGITAWSTNPRYIEIIWIAIVDNNLP